MAEFDGFTPEAFDILSEFQLNNTREWYQENRERYRSLVRGPFATFMEVVSKRLETSGGPRLVGSEKTMFRVNRDIRFSRDKRPYATHVSGLWTPSGRKFEKDGLVFARLDAQGGLFAAGFYQPESDHLKSLRQSIVDMPSDFEAVTEALEKARLQLSSDSALMRMPKGFEDQKSNPHADDIKLKSFVTSIHVPLEEWRTPALVDQIIDFAKSVEPLLEWGRPWRESG